MSTLITPHFSLEEFACRDGTPYPPEWIDTRLRPLCEMLEVIRATVCEPLHVLSGYRTPKYNAKVGGAKSSQHMQGRAADIIISGLHYSFQNEVEKTAAHLWIEVDHLARGERKLPLINGIGRYPTFVHVDIRPGPRMAQWTGSRPQAEVTT